MEEKHSLFNLDNESFSSFISNLTEDDIKSNINHVMFQRAREYYDRRLVNTVNFDESKNSISAIVKGGENYSVRIFSENGQIKGFCSCPYDNMCKHIIAVMIYISVRGIEEIMESDGQKTRNDKKDLIWKKYLESLNQQELVRLVEKFAPQHFRTEIINRNSGKAEAKAVFRKIKAKIENLFNDEELLYSPSEFEAALLNNLNKLKGFEPHLKEEIGKLILFIIEEVNYAFDGGYLYIDDYRGDEYFESDEFGDFVTGYVRQLEFVERVEFLEVLDEALNYMGYSTFEHLGLDFSDYFQDKEKRLIREFLLKDRERVSVSFISRFYKGISDGLKESEKIRLLKRLKDEDESYLIEYCKILMSNEKDDEAYKEIDSIILSDRAGWNHEINFLYLELSALLSKDLKTAASLAMNNCPISKILLRIKRMDIGEFSKISDILKEKNPDEYLFYLEKEKLFSEAVDFINKGRTSEFLAFEFYKRNKKDVVSYAEDFFIKRINRELEFTGESHYMKIAEAIEQINAINRERAVRISEELRTNFKRRTSLIKMISQF